MTSLAALGCAVATGACGASSGPARDSISSGALQGIKFANCMRSHGVPGFPDPSGGEVQALSVNPASPAFQSAQQSCGKLLPGGASTGTSSAEAHAQLLETSKCMRAHGISRFPDPSTGAPPALGGGYEAVIGHGGYFIAIPSSINMQSPAFARAAATCNFGPKRALRP